MVKYAPFIVLDFVLRMKFYVKVIQSMRMDVQASLPVIIEQEQIMAVSVPTRMNVLYIVTKRKLYVQLVLIALGVKLQIFVFKRKEISMESFVHSLVQEYVQMTK